MVFPQINPRQTKKRKITWAIVSCFFFTLFLFSILSIIVYLYVDNAIQSGFDTTRANITGIILDGDSPSGHLYLTVTGFVDTKQSSSGDYLCSLESNSLAVHAVDSNGKFIAGKFPLNLFVVNVSHSGRTNFSIPMDLKIDRDKDGLDRFITLFIKSNQTNLFHAWVTGEITVKVFGIPLLGTVTKNIYLDKNVYTPGIHDEITGAVSIHNLQANLRHWDNETIYIEFFAHMLLKNPEVYHYTVHKLDYDIYFDNPQGVKWLLFNLPPENNIFLTHVSFEFPPQGLTIPPHDQKILKYQVGPVNIFPGTPEYEPYLRLFYLYDVLNVLTLNAKNGVLGVSFGNVNGEGDFSFENIPVPNPNPLPPV